MSELSVPRPSTLLTLTSMLAGSGVALGVPLLAFVYGQQAGMDTQVLENIASMGVAGGSFLALGGMRYGISGPARAVRKAKRAEQREAERILHCTPTAPGESRQGASFDKLVHEQVQAQAADGHDCTRRARFFAQRAEAVREAARTARGHVAKAGGRVKSVGRTARRKWAAAKAA